LSAILEENQVAIHAGFLQGDSKKLHVGRVIFH
jgi:hypothetical protein